MPQTSSQPPVIIPEAELEGAMSYKSFRKLVSDLGAAGKVTGHTQHEGLLAYSRINEQRMNRWDKHTRLLPGLLDAAHRITGPYRWIVITEGWCGDSAQQLPVMQKIADEVKGLELRVVLRDDHPGLMDRFLTAGSRSVPILVCLDAHNRVCWHWGPRPAAAQAMVMEERGRADYQAEKTKERLHLWYAQNSSTDLQTELTAMLSRMA